MAKTYSDKQLRGAFSAGYDKGFIEGQEKSHNEGWRKVDSPADIKPGDIVKLMVETLAGWKGKGVVVVVSGDLVNVRNRFVDAEGKTYSPGEFIGTCDCMYYELMVLRKI